MNHWPNSKTLNDNTYREKQEKIFVTLKLGKHFLGQKWGQETKKKMNLIKIKNFWSLKNTDKPQAERNVCKLLILHRTLVLNKELSKSKRKQQCNCFKGQNNNNNKKQPKTKTQNVCCCSPPGFSVHGISQARILEWVAIFFSRGSPWSRNPTHLPCIAGRFFAAEPPGKLSNIADGWQTTGSLWEGKGQPPEAKRQRISWLFSG